ncbi:U3 small nucleolar ribonucleoprotein imp3 [Coemansia sp. RSA 2523]|nr:U3 small nucleolar ribonucleoprotein imp3 [Coemansia sp. RSA 1591]KAJ1756334.1 U3 small nucleolar ribonucleoprotein imp3 [Coemansia sp. RSA 1752]KAJ1779662.1 U3 small nucleolar ribonucleoprotein imp3 [Coemansia sp. RSA 1824]KAJ1783426.1 U3 small nucleolar ribonucleoprotein imp3 [Coemansia sp. RSA 1938]KAJ1787704.1 U3 small nucleolar ribonucleoprotein imp3 [Coemansia sp. RSA 2167]KAJ1810061.1 U3 small nucleolar ribonucleoprotein imp3 [Coemansia sp. RSA 2523]KAJ2132901.1 U3 small nucleolar r
MVRQLKYHEKKLLRKVDFIEWKGEHNVREIEVMRRYHLSTREEYHKYSALVRQAQKLAHAISRLDPRDPKRLGSEEALLEKLYAMGVISSRKNMSLVDKLTVSAFCRRRLAVIMCRLKMAQYVSEAVRLIEQGHVRVGPDTVTDSAFLVTRNMEDFVTWVDTSKIKRKILKYNDKLDDFDLL